jgi:signal transduction histidine kinase
LETVLPDEPVMISADSTQLKQIFWNLARNSIQSMPEGGKLKITLQKLENERIRILFEDTGCGMSSKQVERLFEPFSESMTGGTGLGLSIVYQIIRDHNGSINVRSLENQGTTITVELPTEIRNQSFSSKQEETNDVFNPSRLEGFLNVKKEEIEVSS